MSQAVSRPLCPVCGFANEPGTLACGDCHLRLPSYKACPACGFANTLDSNFCGACGQRVADPGHAGATAPLPPAATASPAMTQWPGAAPSGPGETSRIVLIHQATGQEIRIPEENGHWLVGRSGGEPDIDLGGFEGCEILSRRHARLMLSGQAFAIEDVGSVNGTFVNGTRVVGQVALQDGDLLAFGQGPRLAFRVCR